VHVQSAGRGVDGVGDDDRAGPASSGACHLAGVGKRRSEAGEVESGQILGAALAGQVGDGGVDTGAAGVRDLVRLLAGRFISRRPLTGDGVASAVS
jgi:hypothetical protein